MSTTLSVESIFTVLSEQRLGFKFGDPDRPSDTSLACILPILRETSQKRQYITMPETEELLVSDSGSINKVNLKNSSKENVFVRSGTIFEGKGTQSRALVRSTVLYPGQEVGLEVRCVHASHGISAGSEFKYGGLTPMNVDSAFYGAGYTPRDQRTMWNAVQTESRTMSSLSGEVTVNEARMTADSSFTFDLDQSERPLGGPISPSAAGTTRPVRMGRRSGRSNRTAEIFTAQFGGQPYVPDSAFGTDNLKKNFDAFAKDFDGILSKARLHDNQAGLALITEHGCKTIEIFDIDVSWEALHKDAVKRMGTELLRGKDETSVFEYKPEHAVKAVQKVLALPFKSNTIYNHKPANGEPQVTIYGVTANKFVGEVVELDNRLIHMVVLETD